MFVTRATDPKEASLVAFDARSNKERPSFAGALERTGIVPNREAGLTAAIAHFGADAAGRHETWSMTLGDDVSKAASMRALSAAHEAMKSANPVVAEGTIESILSLLPVAAEESDLETAELPGILVRAAAERSVVARHRLTTSVREKKLSVVLARERTGTFAYGAARERNNLVLARVSVDAPPPSFSGSQSATLSGCATLLLERSLCVVREP